VAVLLIVDCVLVRVVVGREAQWGGEKVFKWANINCGIKYQGRSRSG